MRGHITNNISGLSVRMNLHTSRCVTARRTHSLAVSAGLNNVWIVKPAGKSRGRGIALFNSAAAVKEYVRNSNDALWVSQKYIERPLRIHGRKFDIRQWVLVTSWSPLYAWFYDDCYLRFAAGRFSTVDLSAHAHLSNNSITKGASASFDGASCGHKLCKRLHRLLNQFESCSLLS